MVGTDIRKRIGIGDIHRFTVHKHLRQMPACGRSKRIGSVITAVHGRCPFGRNRTLALHRCRQRIGIRRKDSTERMVFGYVAEGVATHRAFVNIVHEHRINVVAIIRSDFDGDSVAVVYDRAGRCHVTAVTCRRCHRIFVDDKVGRYGMVGTDIRKRIGIGDIHRFTVHKHLRQMPACGRSKRIGSVITAVHGRCPFGRNRTLALHRCRQRIGIRRKDSTERMVFGYVAEGVATHRAFVNIVHEHRINVVAIIRSDFDGDSVAVVYDRAGRCHVTAVTCRRCHRIFVDDKVGRYGMVGTDIRKRIGVGGIHRFTVHKHFRQMPACGRSERVGSVISAVHGRCPFGRNRTLALD